MQVLLAWTLWNFSKMRVLKLQLRPQLAVRSRLRGRSDSRQNKVESVAGPPQPNTSEAEDAREEGRGDATEGVMTLVGGREQLRQEAAVQRVAVGAGEEGAGEEGAREQGVGEEGVGEEGPTTARVAPDEEAECASTRELAEGDVEYRLLAPAYTLGGGSTTLTRKRKSTTLTRNRTRLPGAGADAMVPQLSSAAV